MKNKKILKVNEIIEKVSSSGIELGPLSFKLLDIGRGPPDKSANFILESLFEGKRYSFVVEVKSRSTPLIIKQAVFQAKEYSVNLDYYPMIIVPYLSNELLDMLESERISGVDLSGNGLIYIPGRIYIRKEGLVNLYREPVTLRNVYRGKSSIVGRVFLLRSAFASVTEIKKEIDKKGSKLSLSTISKVLKRFEEDLIIIRKDGLIKLVQGDKLLDKLAENYNPLFGIKGKIDKSNLLDNLRQFSGKTKVRVMVTGTESAMRYTSMAGKNILSIYTENLNLLQSYSGFEESDAFPNIEIIGTDRDEVFFDMREDNEFWWASPVQSYLELASGNKREKEAAKEIRKIILGGFNDRE